jgi:hypothetical protein
METIDKNYHIELREDGKFYLIDMPEPTNRLMQVEYELEVDQALKDAVEIKDQELASKLIVQHDHILFEPIRNHPYKVDLSEEDLKKLL